ncbi:MAG TPA: phage holin family protein [Longimicrobiales bacterium]|nr:phage holin family protein [Longimicrobiales bacterium]
MATRQQRETEAHPTPVGGRPPATLDDDPRSLGELLRSLGEDTSTLVRQEIRLAKLEAGRTARRVAVNSGWVAAGGGVLALGTICLVLALALGLGALLGSYWLGALITGGVLLLVGGLMAWKGARALRSSTLPRETVESLKTDAEWAKREARDMKKQITSGAADG